MIRARLMSIEEDLLRIGKSCLSLLYALRRMEDMWVLNVSLESKVTPRYLDSLVQAIFSLTIFTGHLGPR
jgi:hypothetical protein